MTELVGPYHSGATVRELVLEYGIGRTTALDHLKRAGVLTRINKRKLTPDDVQRAAELYASGSSLAAVGMALKVDARTIGREFHRAGTPTRPQPGKRSSGV